MFLIIALLAVDGAKFYSMDFKFAFTRVNLVLDWSKVRNYDKVTTHIYRLTASSCQRMFSARFSGEIPFKSTGSPFDGSGNSPYLMLNCCLPILLAFASGLRESICYSREEFQFAFIVTWRPINLQRWSQHFKCSSKYYYLMQFEVKTIYSTSSCSWAKYEEKAYKMLKPLPSLKPFYIQEASFSKHQPIIQCSQLQIYMIPPTFLFSQLLQ